MNAAELDALLRQFLVDGKLSKGERATLQEWVRGNVATDQQRSVARGQVFDAARAAVADPAAAQILTFVEDALKVVVPPHPGSAAEEPDSVAVFSPGDACLGRIIHRLTACRRTADICVFTITDDRIANAIHAAHQRGVKVRVITDNDKAEDLGSDTAKLEAWGIPLLVDRTPFHMHHKFALFDRARLLNGSYNWTRGAAEQNEENLVDTADPTLVAAFQNEFDQLWKKLS
jgi:phosphatidylserine/phosphatidylglycerophosphate/cardiolipin synthase-like enzyme